MKSETSRNVLLIILAVRLQKLVKNLPNNHLSPERITRKSLAEEYLSLELSSSEEGAYKKSGRYLDYIKQVFGLTGSDSSGYAMEKKFPKFRDMFEYWLEAISPPGKDDKRLHVMLNGLLQAIDNIFTQDPIVVPNLARQLKEKYGNKNIRDTRQPLDELFDNRFIGTALQIIEDDDDALYIDPAMESLLSRKRARSEVGGNGDISINLAQPGRIMGIFDHTIQDLSEAERCHARAIAESVNNSNIWMMHDEEYLPYILYREGERGPIILTMRNLTQNHYEDIPIDQFTSIPESKKQFCPFGIDPAIWSSFRQMIA